MSFRIDEPVGISPREDCVFRVLLADPAHTERLVHFLNAVLQRPSPVVSVVVRSPVQLVDRVQEGQVTVDVVATDASGKMFQVEMQTWNHGAIKERVLYTWAALYKGQLDRGEKYHLLRPVVAIWLMDQNIFRDASRVHHRFRVRDDTGTLELSSHLRYTSSSSIGGVATPRRPSRRRCSAGSASSPRRRAGPRCPRRSTTLSWRAPWPS